MRFGNWQFFTATLAIAPLLALFLAWAWRSRQRRAARFVPARLLAMLTVSVSPRRQKLRLALVFLAFVLAGVALARPQWGFEYRQTKQRGLDIIVCIDTSKSMLAEDVAPNRLAKAKLAVLDLRRVAKSDRIGLVAFAGSAFMQMPMSTDDDVLRQNLEAIDTDLLPQGGTAITEAIHTARAAFKDSGLENHRAIVIFTDGEDHDGEAIEAAKKAGAEGAVVLTVGVGTTAGELIPIRDAKGRTSFVKDEAGNTVKSRLNEALLQEIAKAGNGFYVPLAGAGIIETLYERGLAPLPKREVESTPTQVYHERYQWFLGAALALLLAEMLVSDRRRPARSGAPAGAKASSLSAAAVVVALLVSLVPWRAQASASGARKNYDIGKYKTALAEYERLLENQPNDPALQYNAGSAAYQSGRFDAATDHFTSSLSTPDPKLQQHAYYNRGNSQARQGEEADDPGKKMDHWKKAVGDFESALKLSPADADARANLELVKKKIEELEKERQKQQKNDPNSKNEDKKDQEQKNQDKNGDKQQGDNSPDSKNDPKENQNSKKQQENQEKSDEQKKQDASSPDSQSGDKKDERQQPQPKPGEDKSGKDQQANSTQGSEPKDERDKKPGAAQGKEGAEGDAKDKENPEGAPMTGKVMQMTRKDAIRLLEALRAEERLLRPMPPQTNRAQRTIKNW
ncbi:MAG: VWA domain-containing protein [Verrucomicrobia bacterium]|nr:VWA domain-containing protein [Verrucomicrobiota bacterium]MBI3870052.1 VWA domain-containing protein [Verrucomicrobiota bacterium]